MKPSVESVRMLKLFGHEWWMIAVLGNPHGLSEVILPFFLLFLSLSFLSPDLLLVSCFHRCTNFDTVRFSRSYCVLDTRLPWKTFPTFWRSLWRLGTAQLYFLSRIRWEGDWLCKEQGKRVGKKKKKEKEKKIEVSCKCSYRGANRSLTNLSLLRSWVLEMLPATVVSTARAHQPSPISKYFI